MITVTCDKCGRDMTRDIHEKMVEAFEKGDMKLQQEHSDRLGAMLFHQEFKESKEESGEPWVTCSRCVKEKLRNNRLKIVDKVAH